MERIRNLLLIIAVSVFSIFRGKAVISIQNPKKIIVVQNAKLGDMVCTTPVLRAIKQYIPDSYVVVMGDKLNKEILQGNIDVDEYVLFKRKFFKLLRTIRTYNFDFGCVLTPDSYAFSLLFLGGVKVIVLPKIKNGYCPWETKTYKILRGKGVLVPHFMGSYAPREYLRLLEPLNIITDDTTKHLSFSAKADKKVSDFFKERDISYTDDFIVGISPSAGNKVKKWSEEKFAKIADYIYKKYNAKIILIGGSNDVEEVEKMISALDVDTKVIDALKVFNIDELKALISKMDMFISVDTGPIYIAEAFKVPTIDITGPIDEKEQPPIGVFHRVVTPKSRKKPELHVMNAREYNRVEALRQIESITVDMVANEVDKLFIKISKK